MDRNAVVTFSDQLREAWGKTPLKNLTLRRFGWSDGIQVG